MAHLNKVLLIGNLGKDPEIRMTQNGQKQAKFTFATTERYRDRNSGEQRERTEWHNVVAWRTTADLIERMSIRKGTSLYIEGKLRYRSWDDPQGQRRYATDVELDQFQILSPRAQTGNGNGGGNYGNSGSYGANAPSSDPSSYGASEDHFDASADDMPF